MTTKVKYGRSVVRKLTRKQRTVQMHSFIDLCAAVLLEQSNGDKKEIANLTGLSVRTLDRLFTHRCTTWSRIETIQKLGAAAGFELQMSATGASVRVID